MSDHQFSRANINAIAYLSYYFVGALVSTLGIVLGPLSAAFNKDPSFIGQIFTLMNLGMFLPIMFGGILMRKWGLKHPMVIASILTMVISVVLFIRPTLTMFSIGVAVIGACGGIYMTLGSYLVVRINPDEKKRSASLIFTDFFFSFAGATLSFLLAWCFKLGASWVAMYGIMGGLGALMLALTLRCRFPSTQTEPLLHSEKSEITEPWGIAVWLICFALFAFLLAEPIFTLWTPAYLQSRFALAAESAALFTTVYWVAKAIGLFLHQFTVKWMKLRTFLLGCTLVGLLSLLMITQSANTTLIILACGVFGFFNSGIFSALISYGSLQIKQSSPTLVSALLTFGTVGTLVFASLSSFVNTHLGLHAALNSSVVAYGALLLTLLFAIMFSRAESLHQPAESTV